MGVIALIFQRSSRGSACPTDCLKFGLEDRIECSESHKVKYVYRNENVLSLPVPLDKAINNSEPGCAVLKDICRANS